MSALWILISLLSMIQSNVLKQSTLYYDLFHTVSHWNIAFRTKNVQRLFSKDSVYIMCTVREILHIVFTKCVRLETEIVETYEKANLKLQRV